MPKAAAIRADGPRGLAPGMEPWQEPKPGAGSVHDSHRGMELGCVG